MQIINKTEKLKNEIQKQYGSIRKFSLVLGIPSTTLTSALSKDIGNMSMNKVLELCSLLNLDPITFDRLESTNQTEKFSKEQNEILSNFYKLNALGKREANKRVKELTQIEKYHNENLIKDINNYSKKISSQNKSINFKIPDGVNLIPIVAQSIGKNKNITVTNEQFQEIVKDLKNI